MRGFSLHGAWRKASLRRPFTYDQKLSKDSVTEKLEEEHQAEARLGRGRDLEETRAARINKLSFAYLRYLVTVIEI